MDDLRALAEAATPGPWADGGDCIYAGGGETYSDIAEIRGGMDTDIDGANAAYIAAASPDRILALLDVIEAVATALGSEDEIAHGEAYSESRGGLGRCAYCGSDWPCRTQRGIDRLRGVIDGIAARLVAQTAENEPST